MFKDKTARTGEHAPVRPGNSSVFIFTQLSFWNGRNHLEDIAVVRRSAAESVAVYLVQPSIDVYKRPKNRSNVNPFKLLVYRILYAVHNGNSDWASEPRSPSGESQTLSTSHGND